MKIKLKPFKIAHLSDLHLTASDTAARSEPKLFGKLTGMNNVFRQIVKDEAIQESNLILVTGDVTDRGDIDSWRIFWDTIQEAGSVNKLLVIPGNHDVCCLDARLTVFNNKGYRKSDLRKAVNGLQMGNQPYKFPWVKVPCPRIAIFGINSNNLGNFSGIDNALGKLDYYQLEAFARLLWKHRDIPVKIVAMHHSPNLPKPETMKDRFGKDHHKMNRLFSGIPQDQRRTLRLMCLSHRIRLIVHGHVHLAEDRRVNGIRIIGAPPTTEPIDKKTHTKEYPFYTYSIQGKGGRVVSKLNTVAI